MHADTFPVHLRRVVQQAKLRMAMGELAGVPALAGLSHFDSGQPAEAGTPAFAQPAEAGTPTRSGFLNSIRRHSVQLQLRTIVRHCCERLALGPRSPAAIRVTKMLRDGPLASPRVILNCERSRKRTFMPFFQVSAG